MDTRIDLTVHADGAFALGSTGSDAVRVLEGYADGSIVLLEQVGTDWRRRLIAIGVDGALEITSPALTSARMDFMTSVYDKAARAALGDEFFGPWKVGPPIDTPLPGGGHIHIEREGDGTGHYWEKGWRSESNDGTELVPRREWLKTFHPKNDPDHPHSTQHAQSTEWGTVKEPAGYGGGDAHYTTTTTHVDASGGGSYTVVVGESYNPTTGEREKSAAVTQPDGSQYKGTRIERSDGTWTEIRTSIGADGNGTKDVTNGKGSETTDRHSEPVRKESSEGGSHDGDDDSDKGDDPEPDDGGGDDGAPVGDGDQGGYQEGNPDGPWSPFDAIGLARLLGPGWRDGESLDDLGDLDARMRPWLDRIAATLRSSGTGRPDPEELLDGLGAPPVVGFDLHGVVDDELADHDSLGRPPKIFTGIVDTSLYEGLDIATGAVALETLVAIADRVAVGAQLMSTSYANARRLPVP